MKTVNAQDMEYYLLITGSRGMYRKENKSHNQIMRDIVSKGISDVTNGLRVNGYNIHIVEGDANGADKYAGDFAERYGIDCHKFPAEWNNIKGLEPSQIKYNAFGAYNPRAGHIRDEKMHEFLNMHPQRGILCFWDGQSQDIKTHADAARKSGTSIIIYDYENDLWYQDESAHAVIGQTQDAGWTLPLPPSGN